MIAGLMPIIEIVRAALTHERAGGPFIVRCGGWDIRKTERRRGMECIIPAVFFAEFVGEVWYKGAAVGGQEITGEEMQKKFW